MVYKYHMCRGIWPPNFSMQPLSGSTLDQVLSLIQSGHNAHEISSATGYHTSTITQIWSKHCPDIPKPTGGHPCKRDFMCIMARLDRKSTRLNSSHTVISYAVFCLQK